MRPICNPDGTVSTLIRAAWRYAIKGITQEFRDVTVLTPRCDIPHSLLAFRVQTAIDSPVDHESAQGRQAL